MSSENAAHRIAVDWDEAGYHGTGVYIPRRDTPSRFNALAGGRLFPGVLEEGALGYSPSTRQNWLESIELRKRNRNIVPLAIDLVESSFFEDRDLFPPGTIEFDSALLMRNIDHSWHAGGTMRCVTAPESPASRRCETAMPAGPLR
jgi:hypothetical protein